jgi:hypothetical protein
MSSRKRIISQNEVLMVGPSPATGYHFFLVSGSGALGPAAASGGIGVPTELGFVGSSVATPLAESVAGFLKQTQTAFSGEVINRLKQLHRVQSISYDFSVARTPVNQFGELARIDNVILETPTVNLSFNYLLANFANEEALGFVTNGTSSAITKMMNDSEEEKNYFIKTVAEGEDAIGGGVNNTTTDGIGIGNGFMTSYSSEASVGGMPTASISIEGLNMNFQTGVTGNAIPAINPANGSRISETQGDYNSTSKYSFPAATTNVSGLGNGVAALSVLRPGDVTISLKKYNTATDYDGLGPKVEQADSKIQSYNLNVGLSRSPIEKLGSRFAFTREIDFPQEVGLSLNILVDDIRTGSLNDMIDCQQEYDAVITLKDPETCDGTSQVDIARYELKKLTLDSMSFSSDIGSNKTATLDFSTQINGPSQTGIGLFMSGRSLNLGT